MNISILSVARMLAWNWHHDRCSLWKRPLLEGLVRQQAQNGQLMLPVLWQSFPELWSLLDRVIGLLRKTQKGLLLSAVC